ncbi:hypothetical protein [Allosphingosinicella indica]|uniref:Uncharacterized protein n=1 Tax=Allosphingosinicella indica TaxID=941907 RepID=A0A1X7G7E9_9SPHN|nr:hypothetical protein [Allosphingosinicella indica]SMF64845.1 hypothetical protein SAMN06295910_1254 [Allosphingosinicella indica]
MLSKKISALAASALLLASSAAVAQTAPSAGAGALSVSSALMQDSVEDSGGWSTGAVVGVLFGIVVIAAVVFGSDDERDTPVSP